MLKSVWHEIWDKAVNANLSHILKCKCVLYVIYCKIGLVFIWLNIINNYNTPNKYILITLESAIS